MVTVYRCVRCGDLQEGTTEYPLYDFTCECGGRLVEDPQTPPTVESPPPVT